MSQNTVGTQRHAGSQRKKKKRQRQSQVTGQQLPKLTMADRVRLRFGQRTATAVGAGVRIVLYGIAALVSWLSSIAIAVSFVPDMVMMVTSSIVLPEDATVEQLALYWVLPSVFITALVFGALWVGLRLLWRGAHRVGRRAHDALAGDPSQSL